MKITQKLTLGLACAMALLTGCDTVKSAFLQQKQVVDQPAQTNIVFQVVTNTFSVTNLVTTTNIVVVKQQATNADGSITPALLQPVVTTTPTVQTTVQYQTNQITAIIPAVTHTEYATGAAVGGITTAAQYVPVPGVGGVVGLLGGLATVVMTVINNRNKRKAADIIANHQSTITTLQDTVATGKDAVQTLVSNFEDLRKAALTIPAYQPLDAKVMAGVTQVQKLMGVTALIQPHVDALPDTKPNAI